MLVLLAHKVVDVKGANSVLLVITVCHKCLDDKSAQGYS